MNQGSNPPTGQPGGGKGRRRRRGRRGPAAHGAQPHQHNQPSQGQGQGQRHGQSEGGQRHSQGHGQGQHRQGKRHRKHGGGGQRRHEVQTGGGIYTAPMDHSYRAAQGESDGNSIRPPRGRGQQFGKQYAVPEPEPLPVAAGDNNSPARIFAFVDDLFFLAKIQETARKMNVKVEFVKTDKDIYERMGQNGDKPTLVIFDLNSNSAKPLTTIPKLKSKLKKGTNIIGFVSHVQGDLKLKAQEAGCDMVLPRSAFSQNLAALLRRHAVGEEQDEVQ